MGVAIFVNLLFASFRLVPNQIRNCVHSCSVTGDLRRPETWLRVKTVSLVVSLDMLVRCTDDCFGDGDVLLTVYYVVSINYL